MQLRTADIIVLILVFTNLAAFVAFWMDKRRAQLGIWRIPESRLLWIAFFGGSLGALLGQQIMRHKTRKQPFYSQLIAIAIFHIILGASLLYPASRQWLFEFFRQAFEELRQG